MVDLKTRPGLYIKRRTARKTPYTNRMATLCSKYLINLLSAPKATCKNPLEKNGQSNRNDSTAKSSVRRN